MFPVGLHIGMHMVDEAWCGSGPIDRLASIVCGLQGRFVGNNISFAPIEVVEG